MIDHVTPVRERDPGIRGKDLKASSSTFATTIYQDLKDSILTAKLRPNQRITQREIAQLFNVSLTPVREALQRLAAEGYVVMTARSEVKVVELDRADYAKLIELVRLVETGAMHRAIREIPESKIEELRCLQDGLKEQYERDDLGAYLAQSDAIHDFIWKLYDNPFVYEVLTDAVAKIKMIAANYYSYYTPKILQRSFEQHTKLFEAIERRDFRLASRVLDQHWSPDFFR